MNFQIIQKRGVKVRMPGEEDDGDDDIDPELHNEVEIHFTRGSAREMQSSGKSRQTVSRKSSDKKSESDHGSPRTVKSRGRPIKPYETEPFLSIDNLPADKSFVSEKSGGWTRPPTYRTVPLPKSPTMQRTPNMMSPYATPRIQSENAYFDPLKRPIDLATRNSSKSRPSSTPSRSGSRLGVRSDSRHGSRSGSRQGSRHGSRPASRSQLSRRGTPANSPYATPRKPMNYPNHHVKSPFKHSVFKPDMLLEGRQTPSQELKDRTTQAAFYITRLLAMTSDKEPAKTEGRLKKGRLKPLYPVNVEGPSIERCRGIVSEARTYGASPSRTLQRRIHLMNTIPNVHEYLIEHRPCTTESVHQTSAASSDGEVANMKELYDEENMDSNRSIPDRDVYDIESDHGLDGEPLAPENTVLTLEQNDNVSAVRGPEFESKDSSLANTPTPRMFATEVGTKSPEAVGGDLTVPKHFQQEISISETTLSQMITTSNLDENKSKSDADVGTEKVRSVSPSKSVRFAEDNAMDADLQNSKEMKEQTNIAKQQETREGNIDGKNKKSDDDDDAESVMKKNKQNTKSCKSDDIKDLYKKDDDDDKDKDDNKNKDKSNQGNVDTSSRGSSGKSRTDKSNESKSKDGKSSDSQGKKQSRCANLRSQSSSKGSSCSKFLQSSASKAHQNVLQVQTVIHPNTAQNILGPESPHRSRTPSRSCTPTYGKLFDQDSLLNNQKCLVDSEFDYLSQRSKVKFMIEDDEEPQVETIFMEDDNSISLRPDQNITFEAIESELEFLRHTIQNKLSDEQSEETIIDDENDDEVDTEAKELDTAKTLLIEGRNPASMRRGSTVDTTQSEYTDLIEKYRKKCMDRSECCGAFSDMLVSPRKQSTYAYPNSASDKLSHDQPVSPGRSAIDSNSLKFKFHENSSVTYISDSGCGSIDNLSEVSGSASLALSDVPRLNLDGNTSDLDDTEPSSSRQGREDETGTLVDEAEFNASKNILEMVCDVLPPPQPPRKKTGRKQTIRKMMNSHKLQAEQDTSKLKVVATTKCLSKPPQQKLTMSRSSSIPFPPLCFTINARPPAGYLYYFAYGPDMNPNRLSSYIKREVEDRFWALLFGFSLVFNKKGASVEAGGFANLEFNPLRSVEGCMYKITQEELDVLDKCVGYPEHYEHLVLPVWFSNSKDPENYGVCQYCVPALTFIAQNDWTETECALPYDYSLSQCIKGADICSQEYKDSLLNMTRQIEVSA